MADLPSISIVTPCLNAAGTIEEALASVRSQGYPRLEHVVVDGGSTDSTVELLRQADGVRFVSEPDRGRADAVNKGVAMSTGEVIGWLNADDRYEPGALLAVGEALAADAGAMWATGYCRIIGGEGEEIRAPITAYKNFLLRRWSYALYLSQNFVADPATFVRRAALEEAGPLDERYLISHDYDVWLRVARRHPPLVLRRTLASFRMTEDTASMTGFERQFHEHAEVARLHGEGHPVAVAINQGMSRLIATTRRTAAQGRRVLEALQEQPDEPAARRLAAQLGEVLPRLKQGIRQAERRVLKGESVPAGEKLLSLFEPHTQVIPRFKAGKAVEFGRKLRLDEVEGGLISGYAILDRGGGQDQPYLKDSLEAHRRHFGRAPDLLAGDRGLASAENERLAKQAGVKHVALPHVGKAPPGRRAEERGRRFKRAYRFRAGIEGRIHALRRDYGLKRCRYRGERGMGRWVGWGILAHNLAKVAEAGAGR